MVAFFTSNFTLIISVAINFVSLILFIARFHNSVRVSQISEVFVPHTDGVNKFRAPSRRIYAEHNENINNRRTVFGEGADYNEIFNRFTYANPSRQICDNLQDPNNSLIIVISSSSINFDIRQAVRTTWGRTGKYNFSSLFIQTIFFVGVDDGTQSAIRNEQDLHNDVVEIGVFDNPQFSPYKELAILFWLRLYCPLVRLLYRIDDDVYVDIFLLRKEIEHRINFEINEGIHGWFGPQMLAIRSGQMAVTKREYVSQKYPNHTHHMGYLYSNVTSQLLINAANKKDHAIIRPGDVYITGILRQAANISYYTYQNSIYKVIHVKNSQCDDYFAKIPSLLACKYQLSETVTKDIYQYYDAWDVIIGKHNLTVDDL